MKKSCFVFPTHSFKFNDAELAISSYNKHFDDDHIFVVFGNQDEYSKFINSYSQLRYRPIICNNDDIGNSPITLKKFYGLNYVFKNTNFENVGLVDSDIEFFRHKDYNLLFENHLNEKKIYFSKVLDTHCVYIMSQSINIFEPDEMEILNNKFDGGNSYYWFNEVPVYTKSMFLPFYEKYKSKFVNIGWQHFDYLMYSFYLILNHQMTAVPLQYPENIITNFSFTESQNSIDPETFKYFYNKFNPMWILNSIEPEFMKNTFINFHTDRRK